MSPRLFPLLPLAFLDLSAAPAFEPAPSIKGAHGVVLSEFAKEPFLRNVVAVCVDEQGRVYATSVVRRKAADLDIRQFRDWIETDLSLTSVEEKRAFYHRELAPGKGRHKKIGDQNKDGSVDWKDLTVLSDRIVVMEDTDRDGVADKATTYAEGFNTEVTGIAAGITAWDGKIYATVEPDAWKLEDTDGDNRADNRTSLAHGFSVHIAYAGHNFSGPVVGPDGRLYFSAADKGMNVTSREGVNYAHPHSGVIARCELDGSNFEVFAYGLRNVQEPAFDQYGNLFGVDNDGDMKGEKERFLYITEGSDTGWRCNWQYRGKDYQIWQEEGLYVPKHPKQAAYITPCLQTYHDGPTGFAFNPGTALNEFYKDHFFMTAFPSRKLYAFQVEPKGASFEMTGDHLVASGVLMTGINFGPDGALYVADWSAGGYELNDKGGVWKLDDPQAAQSDVRKRTAELLRADWRKPESEKLLELMKHSDQRIRMKAQFEIVRRKEGGRFMGLALDKEAPLLARLHAIWGLGQHLRLHQVLWGDPYLSLYQDPHPEIRAQAARTAGDSGGPDLVSPSPIRTLLSDLEDRPRFFAAIALGRLRDREAFDHLVAYLERDGEDPFHRHAGMMGLFGCATPAQLAGLSTHQSKQVRLAAVVALRRLRTMEITAFLNDSDPLVVAEAARAIHDDESIPGALPALAQLLASEQLAEEATIRRALSAALRLRKPEFAGLVANYAINNTHPEELRLVALRLLAQWPSPDKLDSVEGRYRPLPAQAPHTIRPAIQSQLAELTESDRKALADLARKTAALYGIGIDPEHLLGLIKKDGPGAADALELLADIDKGRYAAGAKTAINSAHPEVRAAALRAMATLSAEERSSLDPAKFAATLSKAFQFGTLAEQRASLEVFAQLSKEGATAPLLEVLDGLASGSLDPALALDVVETAASSDNAKVREVLKRYHDSKDASDPLAPYIETLAGGNPDSGKDLFNTHVAAQCVRCHQVEGAGSNVGPSLGKIGTKEPRYLLESLVVPGATIAAGYGLSSFTMRDGESIGATVLEESEKGVRVRDLQTGKERFLSADTIASRTPAASSMPPTGAILQRKELRDLLAYLQTLK